MKKIMKRYMIANFILMMSISSSMQAMAAPTITGLSEEYEITEDGYVIVDEITEAEVENMIAVNDETTASGNTHYTIIDNGIPARLSDELQDYVYQMCAEYGISGHEKVILAKLYCESGYNPNLTHRNKNGTVDYGIAQINSSNHGWLRAQLGITDFMDPYQSIRAGVFIFSECLKKNGYDESMALVAYNSGKNGIPSSKYSRKVLSIKDGAIRS